MRVRFLIGWFFRGMVLVLAFLAIAHMLLSNHVSIGPVTIYPHWISGIGHIGAALISWWLGRGIKDRIWLSKKGL